jgi:hypothetical protein
MLSFEIQVLFGGHHVTVRADTFQEMHQAAARLAELHRDAALLGDAADAVPEYHRKGTDEWYGFADADNPKRVISFGSARDTAHPVPFFPKGEAGLYDGAPAAPARDTTARPIGRQAAPEERQAPAEPDPDARLSRTINASALEAAQRALKHHGWTGPAYTMLLATYSVTELEDLRQDDVDRFMAEVQDARALARYIERVETARRAKEDRRQRSAPSGQASGPVAAGGRR